MESLSGPSWYSWKQGTMQRLVRHSGQWYCVFRRRILPHSSTVFQQKLQLSGGPERTAGVWLARCVCDVSDAVDSNDADADVAAIAALAALAALAVLVALVAVVALALVLVEDCRSAIDTARIKSEPTSCSNRGFRVRVAFEVLYCG